MEVTEEHVDLAVEAYAKRSINSGKKTIQVIASLIAGIPPREISHKLDISLSRVYNIKNTYLDED